MGFWEGYVAGLMSNMTIELIKKIYENHKNRISELQKIEISHLTDKNLTITALVNMLKKAQYDVLFSIPVTQQFYSAPKDLLSHLECGIMRGVRFRIILLASLEIPEKNLSAENFVKQVQYIQRHEIEIRIMPLEYRQALSTMRFVCVDNKECMITYGLPSSSGEFGFYINNPNLTKSFIELFYNLWSKSTDFEYATRQLNGEDNK